MMDSHEFKELLNKYLDGKASGTEWNELARMVKEGQADELIKAQIDAEWESDNIEKDIPFERYHEMISKIMSAEKHIDHVIPRRKNKYYQLLAAACILLLALPFAGYYFFSRPVEKLPETVPDIVNVQAKPVQLPDGSTVLLAENSRLQYHTNFNGTKREVELWGEGYFDIKDVPSKPFVVKTGKVNTLVLGTAFNIRAYPGEEVVITVTRGKVKVDDESSHYGVLVDNQQLSINTKKNTVIRANVNSAEATAWKDQYLVLDDISMEEAVVIIGDKYHVKILLANEGLKNCRIGGTFFHNQPLEKVLDIVCAVINASYTMHPNNQVIIKGEGCQN